jgi:hypothetical protein
MLRERRRVLERLVGSRGMMFAARRLSRNGLKAWEEAVENGYEGIVAKDPESRYVPGRTLRWLKVRVIAKTEHHLGELFPPGRLHRDHLDRDEPGRRPLLQPARHRGAMDQGGQDGHALDSPLLPPVPSERGATAPRGHCLQSRQFAASARPASRHQELLADESPAAAAQDRPAAHSACSILHAAARGKLLDADAFRQILARIERPAWHPT